MKIVEKHWGREIWVAHTDKYAFKIIEIKAGTRSSLQYHVRKHEHVYVDSGVLQMEWERLRREFVKDPRTIEGLEAFTNREWVRNRRKDPVSHYTAMSWEQLREQPGIGLMKIRKLVEMLGIAAGK